jgi:membrane-associated phospholipid phosphatase
MIFASLKRILKNRYRHIRFRLVDINCLGYMALIGALLPFFHHQVPRWPMDFLIHLVFVVVALEVIRLGEKYPQNKMLWWLRSFYPVAFIAYGWSELDRTVRMFFGSYWANDFLVNADKAIFGAHPTLWVQRLYSPGLDEFMNLCYSGYYFFLPAVSFALFFRGKREETLAAFSIATLGYCTNFVLFYIFPALGPQMIPWLAEMRSTDYTGYLMAAFNRVVQAHGTVRGGCFPSSHVTAAVVWSLVAWRYYRKLGYLLSPMALGVAVSTVYLGYHHAVDPIAGMILGFICYNLALSILKKRGEEPLTKSSELSKRREIFLRS